MGGDDAPADPAPGQGRIPRRREPEEFRVHEQPGSLCSGGFIAYPQRGHVALTEAGRAIAVVEADAPQTSTDLQDAICRRLSTPQARIVRVAVRAYPAALDRGELAHGAEASPTSSAYMNNLGSLHSLGLLDYPERGA